MAGLVSTVCAGWATAILPQLRPHDLRFRVVSTLAIALLAVGWSVILLTALRLVARVRTPSIAVWYAPAAIFIHQFSPTGVAAGLILAILVSRLITHRDGSSHLSRRRFWITLLIASAFQSVAVLVMGNWPLPAAGLLTLTTAILVAMAVSQEAMGGWTVSARSPVALAAVLVVGLTLCWRAIGHGGSQSAAPDSSVGASQQPAQPSPSTASEVDIAGQYTGVILWPDVKPVTMLVAPVAATPFSIGALAQPLSIPFAGEYWMFRRPLLRPPPNSLVRRGTPTDLHFKTSDGRHLQVEARQRLERPIDMACCTGLQVAISNADPLPGTISLQVILADRAGLVTLDLGASAVATHPGADAGQKTAAPEVLRFAFPRAPALDHFDEIRVIFHRALGRMNRSARVSIERFVLVPRGASI